MDTASTVCPVCTLFLRPGITLKQHLTSHPKQKVIEALVKLSSSQEEPKVETIPLQPNLSVPCNPQVNSTVSNQPWNHPQVLPHPGNVNSIHGNHFFIYQQSMSTTSPQSNVLNVNPLSQHYVYPAVFNSLPYVYQQQQVIMSSNSLPPPMRALPFDLSQSGNEKNCVETDNEDNNCDSKIVEISDGSMEQKEEEAEVIQEESVKKHDLTEGIQSIPVFENHRAFLNEVPPEYDTFNTNSQSAEPADQHSGEENTIDSPKSNLEWRFQSELNKACQTQTNNISPRSQAEEDEGVHQNYNGEQPEYLYIANGVEAGQFQQNSNNYHNSSSFGKNFESYEQSDPIYTSANILHGNDHLDLVNVDDIVLINNYQEQVVSPVESFGTSSSDRPGVLMTIGDISQKMGFNEHRDPDESTSSSHVNIKSDERMPPRGELSGQESIDGASDITWNRLQYYEGSSKMLNNYSLIGHDSWENSDSDTGENAPAKEEMPELTPFYEEQLDDKVKEDLVEFSGPNLNFKCSTCNECFNSFKDKREHEEKEHSGGVKCNLIGAEIGKRKAKKIVVKLKSDKTENENNFDNVFSRELKLETPENLPPDDFKETIDLDDGIKDVKTICTICDCILENARALKIHKMEKHKETPLLRHKCQTCGETFPNEYKFTVHLKTHPLECRMCGKMFYRKPNFQLHMKRHLGLKPYKCDICEKSFVTRQKLEEHRNIHTGESPLKCSMCDEKFRRHSNLVQHRNRHHLQIKRKVRDYVCHCGEVFHSKKKLAWHKEIHDPKPKACTQCNEKFQHMSSLTRHMRRAHNQKYLPEETRQAENVECPICKGTYLKSSLDVHIRNHSGQRPFTCLICNKDFTTKWNLKLHKWTHASRTAKPFKCDQCKGAFIRETDYIAHMNSHKSVRPYTCNYCGAQFIRKYNCLRHVKEHENDKTFNCTVCSKSFHRSYYLKDHMRVHSGVRPFICHICGKTSTTKSNHNKHTMIHHAREPVTTEN